jgi:thiamine biosynthesis lipoprotein
MTQEFEYNGKAMGTEYSVAVVCGSKELADRAFGIAKSDIEAYDARFSRFSPESEISVLNEKKDMSVSKAFLDATLRAQELFRETRGVFNPLVQISRFGYDRDFADLKDDDRPNDEESYDIDFSSTLIDLEASRVRLNPGQKLDYGGFLKGYLAEIIARKIKSLSSEIAGVVVNLGGDIHARGLDEHGKEFVFSIYNPVTDSGEFAVTLLDQSLATSGSYKRSWLKAGEEIHHILDASGSRNPESDIISASVVCADGGMAEAYAKVFLSLGSEDALNLLRGNDFSFMTIGKDGKVATNIK